MADVLERLEAPVSDADRLLVARALVPSEREVDAGIADYVFVPEPEQPPEVPRSARLAHALRTFAHDLNLRTIAAGSSPWPLLLLTAIVLVEQLDSSAFGVIVPDLRNVFDVGQSFLVFTITGTLVLGFAFAPLLGHVADRWNRIWPLRIGYAARFGLGNILAGVSATPLVFGTTRVLGSGIGTALATPFRSQILIDLYRPTRIARVFSLIGIGTQLGTIAGPLLGGAIDESVGPLATLVVFGAVGFALTLGLGLVREPERGAVARAEMAELGIEMPPAAPPVSFGAALRALRGIQTVRRMWLAIPFLAAGGLGFSVYLSLYFLNVFNAGPQQRGVLLAVSGVGGLLALIVYGPVVDRLFQHHPTRVPAVIAALLVAEGVSVPVIAVMPNEWLAAMVAVFPTFVAALMLTALLSMATRVIPGRIVGAGLGTFLFFVAAGIGLFVPVLFYVSGRFGFRWGIVVLLPISFIGAGIVATVAPFMAKDMEAATANQLASEEAQRARESGRNKMLICRGVEVFFDGAQVLFGVDFDVEEGELVALLGTNGAGKSTLMRAIAGVQDATYGAIFLDGVDITHSNAHLNAELGVVFMPGGHAVFPTMTTQENLTAAAWLSRHDPEQARRRTEEALALFPRLSERMHTQAGNMSGGEQQMLALAQALIMKPRLLMIDELSLGLAPQVVEQLLAVLRQIHAQGTTVIVVEQSINVALAIAKRAVYMEKGQIRFDGPAADLVGRNDVVRSVFLGGAAASSLGSDAHRELSRLDDDRRLTVLEVSDVSLRYGGVDVLAGVSLEVADREVVGIVGPNGAGKTSLFDVIAGFAKPYRGTVTLSGVDVTGVAPDARARMGLARSYQNVRLFPALTVRENIAVALERHLQNRSAILAALWSPLTRRVERRVRRRTDNLIESLGLGPFADKFMSELSTGTRRIVDIGCVLAAAPSVLLLDEPSSGLAQAETEQLAPVIARIVKEAGCAVVVIEHDLGLIAAVSDRLVAMRLGTVMAQGPPADVLADSAVVDTLLGGVSTAVAQRTLDMTPDPAGVWR